MPRFQKRCAYMRAHDRTRICLYMIARVVQELVAAQYHRTVRRTSRTLVRDAIPERPPSPPDVPSPVAPAQHSPPASSSQELFVPQVPVPNRRQSLPWHGLLAKQGASI
eukprot:3184992-Pleurochrysis_carterae.AAC.1